jgi:hypothetical protein
MCFFERAYSLAKFFLKKEEKEKSTQRENKRMDEDREWKENFM